MISFLPPFTPSDPEHIPRAKSSEYTVPVVLATTADARPSHRKPLVPNSYRKPVNRNREQLSHQDTRSYEEIISSPFSSEVTETVPRFTRPLHPGHRQREPTRALHSDDFVTRVIGENEAEIVHIVKQSPRVTSSPSSHASASSATTLAATSTTTTTTTTTASPVETTPGDVTNPPREVISSDPSYIRESRSQLLPDEAKVPLLIPVRKRLPASSQYTIVSPNGQNENPSYVPSDVYTIETTTKYRPRTMHSNSIFYQKALAYLKAYKKELVSRRPLGPTYRLNAHSDEPSHIVTAYGEIPPVVADSYTYDSVAPPAGNSLITPGKLYQQQEIEQPNSPNHDEVLSVTDQDREVIGYLPVIRIPRKKQQQQASNKQENIPYASASASSSSSSSSSSSPSSSSSVPPSTPVNESSIMGKKPISPSAASYLSPSLRLRKQSSSSSSSSSLHHRSNRIIEPSASSSMQSFGYSPIVSLVEPSIPVLTVSVKRAI